MECIVENLFEDGEWAILEWRDPAGLRGCGFFNVVDGGIVSPFSVSRVCLTLKASRRMPSEKALQLAGHRAFQLTFGSVWH